MSNRFTNPFYAGSNTNAPTDPGAPPPAYSRPVPPAPSAAPVTYSSLSDLTKGRQPAPPPRPVESRPQAASQSSFGQGPARDSGRRVPPPPSNYGVPAPMEPPRRNVPERTTDTPPPAAPSRFAQAQKTAGGYIPNSVSATATSVGDRVREGYDSLTTQQRREQVAAGAGKVAAGAAKLAGKAAWQLGKFASGSKT